MRSWHLREFKYEKREHRSYIKGFGGTPNAFKCRPLQTVGLSQNRMLMLQTRQCKNNSVKAGERRSEDGRVYQKMLSSPSFIGGVNQGMNYNKHPVQKMHNDFQNLF